MMTMTTMTIVVVAVAAAVVATAVMVIASDNKGRLLSNSSIKVIHNTNPKIILRHNHRLLKVIILKIILKLHLHLHKVILLKHRLHKVILNNNKGIHLNHHIHHPSHQEKVRNRHTHASIESVGTAIAASNNFLSVI